VIACSSDASTATPAHLVATPPGVPGLLRPAANLLDRFRLAWKILIVAGCLLVPFVVVTAAFLEFSATVGNDLATPRPEYGFPGLKPGDRWCLCAMRWEEARAAGLAPPVVLEATNFAALRHCALAELQAHAAA